MKRVVFITFKSYEHYFRKYLIQRMIESGDYETMYIAMLGEKICIHVNGRLLISYKYRKSKYLKVIKHIKDFRGDGKLIIWYALTFGYWKIYLFFRLNFPRALIIYDIFDYFYYDEQKKKRLLQFKVIDTIHKLTANRVIVLSRQLTNVYKKAHWLNNASHLTKKSTYVVHNRLAVIAAIDYRLDFHLLEQIARGLPGIEIAIYGWIKPKQKDIQRFKQRMNYLVTANQNINYYGEYKNDELENILSTTDIGLAPYVTDFTLTKYINPDKYFHYLCYGLEVISTPIQAARELNKWIHICDSPEGFIHTIRRIYEGENLKNTGEFWKENNWDKRLRELEADIFEGDSCGHFRKRKMGRLR